MENGLPYFTVPELWIFKPFGLLVATGVLVGANLIFRRVERTGLDPDHGRSMVTWAVVFGFIGAHVLDVIFYQPEALRRDPLLLIKLWAGISSYGGFVGGFLGWLWYMRRHRLPILAYGDSAIYGLAVGFTFGRAGCTIVHDHIGVLTDFPLAMNYTAEVVAQHRYPIEPGLHHNLGLYEFVFMVALCLLLWALDRKPRRPGVMIAATTLLYGGVRFFLDYLRIRVTDPRYFGFTFAQWMSLVLVIVGVAMFAYLLMSSAPAKPPTRTGDDDDDSATSPSKGGAGKSGGGKSGSGTSGSAETRNRG